MMLLRLVLALGCVGGMSTDAVVQRWETPPARNAGCGEINTLPPGTTLHGSFVYIYSFLDISGHKVLDRLASEMHGQLGTSFAAAGIGSKLLPSRQNPATTFDEQPDRSRTVDVGTAIAANAGDEAATGARFRLIAFPTEIARGYQEREFDVCWTLVDIRTGRQIWWTRTIDSKVMFAKGLPSRAKSAIDSLMAALRKSGLL